MSQLLRTRSFAAVSLLFVGAGLVAIACGSDKSANPSTNAGSDTQTNLPNQPDDGASNTPGSETPSTNTPSGAETPAGSEGPMGEIPVQQNPDTPGAATDNPDQPGMPAPSTPAVPITANCNPPEGAVPNLALEPLGNFNLPIYVTGVPGDDSRLMVVEKTGAVRVLVNGQVQPTPFIDVSALLNSNGTSERGLLGMAFHPDFQSNGLFYLHFSSAGGAGLPALGDTVVAEFTANAERTAADPATRRSVLTFSQPQANHNGGQLAFGPDKMLYLGFGDGGGGNDQHGNPGNGQSLNTLLAKILRIDPLGREVNDAYSVPTGNLAEVTGQQANPEIWAYGLRNPWRFSFDACNGDLYIGDVGQDNVEEVDYVAADSNTRLVTAGRNFGWRIMEGGICRPGGTEPCTAQTMANLTLPIDSYLQGAMANNQRGSVTGGYVYRGSAIPGLRGTYIYADYVRSTFFRFRVQGGELADKTEITNQMRPVGGGNLQGQPASFGQDNQGELYVATLSANAGAVYRLVAAP